MLYKICSGSNLCIGRYCAPNLFLGGVYSQGKYIRISAKNKFPQVALKLPTNFVDINAAEVGRFSPARERDLSGPVINSHWKQEQQFSGIDVTLESDSHANKYDCRGAVSLSSSMQSNVPSPFSGNHTHLSMPGSQWGQGYKYLSDHLRSAHYLTLRNEYREAMFNKDITVGKRKMSTEASLSPNTTTTSTAKNANVKDINQLNPTTIAKDGTPALSSKEKLKKAVKDYGATVIVFHVTISLASLGGCYLLVSSGVDVVGILKYFKVGEGTLSSIAASNAGTFVLAYAVHKFFAPFRIAVTLTATPFIVRFLRNMGVLKHNVSTGGGK